MSLNQKFFYNEYTDRIHVEELLVLSVVVVFVGVNVGGSSTAVAFGPAVGANTVTRLGAGVLMSLSALVGGWIVGRNVVMTIGHDIVAVPEFGLPAGLLVLCCIGAAILAANMLGVPASMSMVAVAAIVEMGVGTAGVHWAVLAEIVGWWLLAPAVAFAIAAAVGRMGYTEFAVRIGVDAVRGTGCELTGKSTSSI